MSSLGLWKHQFNSETHESLHTFTGAIRLGAQVPDSLATCNAVESESSVRSKGKLAESDEEPTRRRQRSQRT